MQQICEECSAQFDISPIDVAFYKEIGAPHPAQCPACRSQIRCMHRNERNLYKRECNLCQKNIVSMYARLSPFPVYCPACFYSDKWNPLDFGMEYKEGTPFFGQLKDLYERVPRLSIMNKQSENSDYCNYSYANKNCYLTAGSHYEEDCLYGAYSTKNRDCLDSLWIYESELLYECMFSKNCYRSFFLDHCEDCRDCLFSRDLKGCSDCLFSANLRQKKFCVFNEQKTESEYQKILSDLQLHTFPGLEAAQNLYKTDLPMRFPVRALYLVQCENCEGDMLSNCKNMRQCFYGSDSEDCAYGTQISGTYNSMDIDNIGYDRSERLYQSIGCLGLFDCVACNACWNGSGLRYCQYCFSCKDSFGCVSLQQQDHCILNKKYSEEEYESIRGKIKAEMMSANTWGTFFPPELSPFGYNESVAQDWVPLQKAEAMSKGYKWKEDEKMSDFSKIIDTAALPDSIDDIPDDVLNWGIRCALTKRPYKIVSKELNFYRNMRLPVPRIHPDERHRERKALRNPRKLWNRQCAKCSKEIQTTYQPSRPEIVYCEECYLSTVY